MNGKKKEMAQKSILFRNNWIYTLLIVFLCTNVIFFSKMMQTGDKGVINAMINIDQNIARRNMTAETAQ